MVRRAVTKLLLVGISLIFASPSAEGAVDRPNILIVLADDMGLGDTSAYQSFTGNRDEEQVLTPQMDRLARMGIRFTDAHTPSSRCTPTRYALLTGRYPWRNRLKHWVLFGSQGDPMIESDRPTLATMLGNAGYRCAMVGKWHVGLRYRRSDGSPAGGWEDADLTQPLFDTPLDHGFHYCRITSRSHASSGPQAGDNRNSPTQSIGPGHIHGRSAVSASGHGKKLVDDGPHAYVLAELGGRHSDHAMEFLEQHFSAAATRTLPFFLYYASNSNHAPHTPDTHIGTAPVAGAARNVAGGLMDKRSEYIYENDAALGRLLDYLERSDDPRRAGKKLIENTIVIFTSDNGAEKDHNSATGPFRSNKGSVYEGGHRVPFVVAWPAGGVGNGNASDPGRHSDAVIGLTDLYATFAEILGLDLPDLGAGSKGGEDSVSVLTAWRGGSVRARPLLFNDHKEAADHAAGALRLDDPVVGSTLFSGNWKLFFDAGLLRKGQINPTELYDLAEDPEEKRNRINDSGLEPLVTALAQTALLHRTAGGHRLAALASGPRVMFDWRTRLDDRLGSGIYMVGLLERFAGKDADALGAATAIQGVPLLTVTVAGRSGEGHPGNATFSATASGLGLSGGSPAEVDGGESLVIRFSEDVIVESAEIVSGTGSCGGFYRMSDHAPVPIYCVDGDNDARDQSGILSDLGVLKAGQNLHLESSPHLGADEPGRWRLAAVTVRLLGP